MILGGSEVSELSCLPPVCCPSGIKASVSGKEVEDRRPTSARGLSQEAELTGDFHVLAEHGRALE